MNQFFGFIRKTRKRKNNSNTILIVSLHLLGDSIYTLPTIKHILRDFPNKRISFLTFPVGAKIYNHFFPHTQSFVVDKKDFLIHRIAKGSVRKLVKSISPELIIDITGAITSATSIFTSNSKIVGMNIIYFKRIYKIFVPISDKIHLMKMYLQAVEPILINGIDNSLLEFKSEQNSIRKILIFPFAGWKAKEWSFENFIILAKELSVNFQVRFVFEKHQLTEELVKKLRNVDLEYKTTSSLNDLFNEINDCDLFISNDSGPLHLAQAFGKFVFIIYGPTNPNFSIPFGNNFDYIRKEISCSPIAEQYCNTLAGRYCKTLECMKELTVEMVNKRLMKFIMSRSEEK